jgi:hypothetical protein
LSKYAQPVPGNQNLPASFYLSAVPSWFGSTPWPPIGPDVTGGNIGNVAGHAYKIPAQVCFETTPTLNGILNFDARNCYGGTVTPPTPPTNLRIIGAALFLFPAFLASSLLPSKRK